ncbi:MAG: right-handed parallel beta-helix repeat-containing protein [Candidatus Acidiferrales bacterium]
MKIRKKLLRTTMIVAAGLITCFAATQAQATTTLAVGTCKPNFVSYTTIQAAVNAAPAGTTIDVCPGYYAEQVTITTNSLTLLGIQSAMGDSAVIITPTAANPAGTWTSNATAIDPEGPAAVDAQIAVVGATGVTISHITVDGANSGLSPCSVQLVGIYYENSTGTVTDSVARNQTFGTGDQCGWGIATENTSGLALTVSNSSVHNFQKNGIVARGAGGSTGPVLTATGNTVIGVGATGEIAQNGIEVAYGAAGSVKSNYVADLLYTGPVANGTATGILFYQASGSPVAETNVVESANTGIGDNYDTGATISSNHIGGTQIFDGIDLCDSGAIATGNLIYNSTESGIHLDDSCGTGTGASVKTNTINEACAGILLGTGSNTVGTNTYENVGYTTKAGDTCTLPTGPNNNVVGKTEAQSTAKGRKARP